MSGIQKLLDLFIRTEQAEPPMLDPGVEYEVQDIQELNVRLRKLEKITSTIRGES